MIAARQTRIFLRNPKVTITELWAERLLAEVIKPITAECEWFWFSRYWCTLAHDDKDFNRKKLPTDCNWDGWTASVRFRFLGPNKVERALRARIKQQGYWISDIRPYKECCWGDAIASQYLAECVHKMSELVLSQLEDDGTRKETAAEAFTTLGHLAANIPGVLDWRQRVFGLLMAEDRKVTTHMLKEYDRPR